MECVGHWNFNWISYFVSFWKLFLSKDISLILEIVVVNSFWVEARKFRVERVKYYGVIFRFNNTKVFYLVDNTELITWDDFIIKDIRINNWENLVYKIFPS